MGHLEQLVPFRPHRELLGPYFILLETSPNDVVAMFECYTIFHVIFSFFFSQAVQMFAISVTSKRMQGQKAMVLRA